MLRDLYAAVDAYVRTTDLSDVETLMVLDLAGSIEQEIGAWEAPDEVIATRTVTPLDQL